jgi:RNA polymerase subunit RPABC4/transcription elongation factor Spt4
MNREDFVCEKCNQVIEHNKINSKDNFPEKIECPFCKELSARRKWSGKIIIPQNFKAV